MARNPRHTRVSCGFCTYLTPWRDPIPRGNKADSLVLNMYVGHIVNQPNEDASHFQVAQRLAALSNQETGCWAAMGRE